MGRMRRGRSGGWLAVAVLAAGLLLAGGARAHDGHGGHEGGHAGGWHGGWSHWRGGWGGGWHGRWGPDVYFGVGPGWWGWGSPWWFPPPYYEPRVVIQQPPVYIERQPEQPPTAGYWYYCESAGAYYPSVSTCPEAWIRVPPRPE
jgi:hypothetical protein